MGVLYLGRRRGPAGFSRPVAIKVIHDHLAQNKRFCRMFIDEAKLSARIDDPNVVRVEEFGEDAGRYYLVMEYVHGASLAQVLGMKRGKGLPIDLAVSIAMQICAGLHAAHEATDDEGRPLAIVHRDVSPHNVLVSYKGNVRVIDFGIAKARDKAGGHTQTGSLRGKLAYMPPEQARSARTVDRRADIYAVGLVLWEMLTGRRMFSGKSEIEVLNQIRNPVIVPPSTVAHDVTKPLDDLVLRTLAQDPEGRPATAAELQRLLAEACEAALRVMPADVAKMMSEVRDAARKAKEDDEDPSGLYGQEVLRNLTVFGKSMDESLERADAARPEPSEREIDDDVITHPAVQDKTEAMIGAPVHLPAPGVDDEGVTKKRLALTPPEKRTMLLAPPAKRTREKTVRLGAPTPLPLAPSAPPSEPRALRPTTPPRRQADRTMAFAVLLPLVAAVVGAVVLLAASARPKNVRANVAASATAATTAELASEPTPEPPVLSPPAPEEPEPPSRDVAPRARSPRAPASSPSSVLAALPTTAAVTALDKARQAALEGRPGEVRQLLEGSVRSGHASLDAARLVKMACKAQGDAACRDDINAKYPALAGGN
jgi:serine/threonine-protein kinase